MGEKLDEPGFVLDLFVEDAGGEVIGARVFAEGHAADRAPASYGAALGLDQKRQDVDCSGRVGHFGGGAAGLVMEGFEIIGRLPPSS